MSLSGIVAFSEMDHLRGAARGMDRAFALRPEVATRAADGPDWAMACHINRRVHSVTGQGPLHLADGSIVVAEAVLKDRDALIDVLGLGSCDSDARLVAKAIERWGAAAPSRLKGMFAFAHWSPAARTLTLCRDRTGEFTLFYASDGSAAAFASLPTALFDLPFVDARIDERAIARTLARDFSNLSATVFEGVRQLAPGCIARITPGGVAIERYWEMPVGGEIKLSGRGEYAEALREQLDRAIGFRLRCTGTGTVGTTLSGGLDSTAVAALAARRLGAQGRRLTAFTMAPSADEFALAEHRAPSEEVARAQAVAAAFANMDHVIDDAAGFGWSAGFDDLQRVAGHPFLSSARWYALHPLFQRCQDHEVGVLMGGAHGNLNMSFDGRFYPRRLALERRYGRLGWLLLRRLAARGAMDWRGLPRMLRRVFADRETLRASVARDSRTLDHGLSRGIRRRWLPAHADWLESQGAAADDQAADEVDDMWLADSQAEGMRAHFEKRVQWLDGWMNAAIGAQYGIEVRDPTADADLWEFCAAVPDHIWYEPGRPRNLIRRAMRGIVPDVVLGQRGRGALAIAWSDRMAEAQGGIADRLDMLAASPLASRVFDRAKIDRLVAELPPKGTPFSLEHVRFAAGLSTALSTIGFIHWVEAGRPSNGLGETRVAPYPPEGS